jgi:hypothetical protein
MHNLDWNNKCFIPKNNTWTEIINVPFQTCNTWTEIINAPFLTCNTWTEIKNVLFQTLNIFNEIMYVPLQKARKLFVIQNQNKSVSLCYFHILFKLITINLNLKVIQILGFSLKQ